MALVMIVLLFMMEQRVQQLNPGAKLSYKDIEILLARILPCKDLTVDDLEKLIRKKVEQKTAVYEKIRLTK